MGNQQPVPLNAGNDDPRLGGTSGGGGHRGGGTGGGTYPQGGGPHHPHGGGGGGGGPSSTSYNPYSTATSHSTTEGYKPTTTSDHPTSSGYPRASSDASMTDAMPSSSSSAAAPTTTIDLDNFLDDDTVPTVFRWEHGGRQVYITGTFNGWSRQIPMHRSGNDFTYIHNLKRGKHAFKFIVDDEWRFAPDQPTVADIEGRINNFIDVTDFQPYTGDRDFEKEKAAAEYGCYSALPDNNKDTLTATSYNKGTSGEGGNDGTIKGEDDGGVGVGSDTKGGGDSEQRPDRDGEVFSHTMPDLDEYTKEPPPLPPHLRHIILNKPPQLQDTAALPVPQHVALNHLYCTAIKDNMMVLGITQRFKTKFVTTVYYSPCSSK
mmetsp:Transcript_19289/g.25344  ORF Transcript_19289/g.25344 Transcript_19289/m.25344 type:complete len:375 (-) Transcript_19289:393-1517(-)